MRYALLLAALFLALPAQAQTHTYDSSCLAVSGRVLLEDHGTLTTGAAADSTQRAANATAINDAIVATPAGSALCLPADSLYLAFDEAIGPDPNNPDNLLNPPHIVIDRDSITVWGAGACGWGDLASCTYLATPGTVASYWHTAADPDGTGETDVVRGNGIYMAETQAVRDITLKGFHLDGQAGHTGLYTPSYDQDLAMEDEWDLTHKGINFSFGAYAVDRVTVEDVQVSRYRGEMLYVGGRKLGTVDLRRVKVYGSNGSVYNLSVADTVRASDSQFGSNADTGSQVRFWMELLSELKDSYMRFTGMTLDGCAGASCVALAVDDTTKAATMDVVIDSSTLNVPSNNFVLYFETGSDWTFTLKNSTITDGGAALTWTSGFATVAMPTIHITNNDFTVDGTARFLQFGGNPIQGTVSGNSATGAGGRLMSFSNNPDLSGLTVSNNTYTGFISPHDGGVGSATLPLMVGNTYNYTTTLRFLGSDGEIAVTDEIVRVEDTGDAGGLRRGTLATYVTDGQKIDLINVDGTDAIILPADSTQHAWTTDITLAAGDTVSLEYDASAGAWKASTWVTDLVGGATGGVKDISTTQHRLRTKGADGLHAASAVASLRLRSASTQDSVTVKIDSLGYGTMAGYYGGAGVGAADTTTATASSAWMSYTRGGWVLLYERLTGALDKAPTSLGTYASPPCLKATKDTDTLRFYHGADCSSLALDTSITATGMDWIGTIGTSYSASDSIDTYLTEQ